MALVALALVSLITVIWAIVSILGIPNSKWELAGKSKGLWIALMIVGLIFGVGLVVALIYLLFVAPKVRNPNYRQGYTTHGVAASSIADLPPDDLRRKATGL